MNGTTSMEPKCPPGRNSIYGVKHIGVGNGGDGNVFT